MIELPPKKIIDEFIETLTDIYREESDAGTNLWKVYVPTPPTETEQPRPFCYLSGTIDQVALFLSMEPLFWNKISSQGQAIERWNRGSINIPEMLLLTTAMLENRKEIISSLAAHERNIVALSSSLDCLPSMKIQE